MIHVDGNIFFLQKVKLYEPSFGIFAKYRLCAPIQYTVLFFGTVYFEFLSAMRERKMAMKRATRPGDRLVIGYSSSQISELQHNVGNRKSEVVTETRKRMKVKTLDSVKDHEIIARSVKEALQLRQQQFLNKV